MLSKGSCFCIFATFKVVRLGCSLLTGFILFILATSMQAQVMETRTKVDTLTTSQRLSLRTNAIDWLLLTPNIGVEYDLLNKNWSRWAIGMNLRGNWQSSHTYKPGMVYNTSGVKLELRNYRRRRQMNYSDTIINSKGDTIIERQNNGFDPHRWWTARLFSPRRKDITKFATTTYYRGVYLSHSNYSILLGREGKQGSAFGLGMTYGIIRPLFEYQNGSSLDFELGISGGIAYTKYDTYRHNRESNCYSVVESKGWHIVPYPVITEIKVGFVYRFGKYAVKKKDKNGNDIEKVIWEGSYPITKKYRWRYDADSEYQSKVNNDITRKDSLHRELEREKKNKAEQKEKDKAEKKKNKEQKNGNKKADKANSPKIKKGKKKKGEEEKKNGDTAFIIKEESEDWSIVILMKEERRRSYV